MIHHLNKPGHQIKVVFPRSNSDHGDLTGKTTVECSAMDASICPRSRPRVEFFIQKHKDSGLTPGLRNKLQKPLFQGITFCRSESVSRTLTCKRMCLSRTNEERDRYSYSDNEACPRTARSYDLQRSHHISIVPSGGRGEKGSCRVGKDDGDNGSSDGHEGLGPPNYLLLTWRNFARRFRTGS